MTSEPPANQPHILVVEDERAIARFIELELAQEGYHVTVVSDGIAALIHARQQPFDLVILDLMIPGVDGLEVCRRLRSGQPQTMQLPIIIVTARDAIPDRVLGLKSGADDYLAKPFSIEELLARVEALLRRTALPNSAQGIWLSLADLTLHTGTREVRRANQRIELTAKEYDLLHYLLRHPRQVLSREQIIAGVWGNDFDGESNVVDVYIRYLRNKLDTSGPRLIHTMRGVGYVLREV